MSILAAWNDAYVHTLWDNKSGKKSEEAPVGAHCRWMRDMRGFYVLAGYKERKRKISALWYLKMARNTKNPKDSREKRVLGMENFYILRILAKTILDMMDGEVRINETVNYINFDGNNHKKFEESIDILKD